MGSIQWFNERLPGPLKLSVVLLYAIAVLTFLSTMTSNDLTGFFAALFAILSGWAIANEQRGGYYLAVVVAIIPVFEFLFLIALTSLSIGDLGGPFFSIRLILSAILLAMLLQSQSRNHQRTWFS